MFNESRNIILAISTILVVSNSIANEIYIEQAGDTGQFTINQNGSGNRVGSTSTASTFTGNSIAVSITQAGANNTADVKVLTGLGVTVNYTATGDANELVIDSNNSGTTLNIAKTGDTNRVTVCGTNDKATAQASAVSCTAGVSGIDTDSTVNIVGNSNNVNLALGSPNAVNVINIGNNTASNSNTVNLTQIGTGVNQTNITVNGSTNLVNVTQQ